MSDTPEVWTDTPDDADYQKAHEWKPQTSSYRPPHAEVLAAIDKARWAYCPDCIDTYRGVAVTDRNAHCDDLRATAEIHAPSTDPVTEGWCMECEDDWPCRTVNQVVIDRLKKWGQL